MRTFRVTLVCAFAGALMACNVAALHAAPLPTNVAAMKSMVADRSVQVRWGYRGHWRHRGWLGRSWEKPACPGPYMGWRKGPG